MPPQTDPADGFPIIMITLQEVDPRESIPERVIRMQQPTFDIKIGRGSQTELHLHPHRSNAWFTSRVMSREHALLRADTCMRQLFIEDTGSMHGTYIQGVRLEPGQCVAFCDNDVIQFGTEIIRGDQTYSPLNLRVSVDWDAESVVPIIDTIAKQLTALSNQTSSLQVRPSSSLMSHNSFSIDYSDEEIEEIEDDDDEDDDDIQIVYESITGHKLNFDRLTRTFSVPDSDDSDSNAEHNDESAPSSPTDPSVLELKKDIPQQISEDGINGPNNLMAQGMPATSGTPLQNTLSLADEVEEEQGRSDKENARPNIEDAGSVDSDNIYIDEDQDLSEDDIEDHASDIDDRSDEEEEQEQVFEEHLEAPRFPRCQNTNEVYHRSASPSDAALPKPSWFPPNNLPAIHNLVGQGQPEQMPYPDTFPSGAPPMPPFQPLCYYPTMNWNNEPSTGFVGAYDHSFGVPALNSIQPDVQHAARQCIETIKSQISTSSNQPDSRPSKVSINDIIDDVRTEPTTNSKRKRKADEISTTMPAEEISQVTLKSIPEETTSDCNADNGSVQMPEDTGAAECIEEHAINTASTTDVGEKSSPGRKTVTFSPDAVIINSEPERPRKKLKTHQEQHGSTFMKYLATAVAGATLGAVGTVFGLAALPADYFI